MGIKKATINGSFCVFKNSECFFLGTTIVVYFMFHCHIDVKSIFMPIFKMLTTFFDIIP